MVFEGKEWCSLHDSCTPSPVEINGNSVVGFGSDPFEVQVIASTVKWKWRMLQLDLNR